MDTPNPREQRKSKRFQLDEESYALLRQPLYSELGKILDLSQSGISFLCLNEGGWAEEPFEIDIYCGHDPEHPLQEQHCLKSLPLEPISYAAELGEFHPCQEMHLKRCGGQFGALSPEQEAGLAFLLRRQGASSEHGSDD